MKPFGVFLLLVSSALAHITQWKPRSPATSAIDACCVSVSESLGNKVVYPGGLPYNASVSSYWAINAQLTPYCIIQPLTPQDVSLAVSKLVEANDESQCQFAVRSGGHSPVVGAANIEPGVTIDLSLMNKTTYFPSNSTASIGPGATWGSVYETLEPFGVSVTGARARDVGVGGYTIGGGRTFFHGQYGWTCDNVANFEVVLASGEIVNANNETNSDLFTALKGGSSNFGIVTRFDFYAFQQGEFWGGLVIYPDDSTTPQQLPAFVDFTNSIADDPRGSLISFWMYNSSNDQTWILNAYDYTRPTPSPFMFEDYLAIVGESVSTLGLGNQSELVQDLQQQSGFRNSFHTLTFGNDQRILQKSLDIHKELVAFLKATAHGNWTFTTMFEPFPAVYFRSGQVHGPNVLGLDRFNENLVQLLVDLSWKDPADDSLFYQAGETMITQVDEFANSIGMANEFIHLNHAGQEQNPLRSYGTENLEKLQAAAAKYDPDGVFQTMVPGGFKVSEA